MTPPERPFDTPWQAQLFALTVALNEAGAFTWAEWSTHFGPRVQKAEEEAYWTVWSEALVAVLESKALAGPGEVDALRLKWQAAARATPHGREIRLDAGS